MNEASENKAVTNNKENKKILFLQISITVILLLFLIFSIICAVLYYRLLSQFGEEQRNKEEQIANKLSLIEEQGAERAKKINEELLYIKEEIADIKETQLLNLNMIDSLSLLTGNGDQRWNMEIIAMISEKMSYDYTQRAMQYFTSEDFMNAYFTFGRALRYHPENTVLQFYYIYSLYLHRRNTMYINNEPSEIQERINKLKNSGFREQDILDYSIEEMEGKINDMEYNLREKQQESE